MLAPKIVDEVLRLLREGKCSQRAIARRLGISRGTVCAIATGKRGNGESPAHADGGTNSSKPAGPPERCPGCGAMVHMPCQLCRARAAAARRSTRPLQPVFAQLDASLEPELKETHRKRYEEIHRRKLREAPPPVISAACEPEDGFAADDDLLNPDLDEVLDAFEFDDEPLLYADYSHNT